MLDFLRGQRVLLTGGAGFIGSAWARRVVQCPDVRILNVDVLTYAGNEESLGEARDAPNHELARVDIRDRGALRELFDDLRPTAVVHLAAESHVDRSIDGPADFVETNVLGTFNLLEESRRHWSRLRPDEAAAFRFHHVSTDEVCGSLPETGRFTAESRYDPSSPYSATKAASDHLARAWHRTYGLPVLITSCSNNYGPYQFPEKLIPLTILYALEGHELPVYGTGRNVRDWLHVDDHVAAMLRVLEGGVPGETYLVGGDAEWCNVDLVTRIADLVDELAPRSGPPRRDSIRFVPDRPGHDARYAVDASRIREELGWRPSRGFEEGLGETVRWYRDNRTWWERVRSGAYRGGRLGLGPVES